MRRTLNKLVFTMALAIHLSPVPAHARPDLSCRGEDTLEKAAHAYKRIEALSDVARYGIRVPGAPPHNEVVEFGFGAGVQSFLRMPKLYLLQVRDGRLLVTVDGEDGGGAYLAVDARTDLQEAVDAAFGGQGPPLVPVPLLLRRADSLEDRLQAFRSKLLAPLRLTGCRSVAGKGGEPLHEVTLEADNGTVTARFDAGEGWLVGFEASITPAPGEEPILAEVLFAPRAGVTPPTISQERLRAGRQVTRLAYLSGDVGASEKKSLTGALLTALDGSAVRVTELGGSLVLLEFWATWCAPCRATLPAVQDLARWARAAGLPLRVVLVNTEENFPSIEKARPAVERHLAQMGIDLPSLVDLDGSVHRSVGGGLPLTLLVAPNGEVLETHGGFKPELGETLRLRVRALLEPPSSR